MIFHENPEKNEYPVYCLHSANPELFDHTDGSIDYDCAPELIAWLRDHTLEPPKILVIGGSMMLHFTNSADQFHFKLRFYRGIASQ